jgi:pSer/pThr/pTyr-binding forkhead associated (FHA) protein
MKAPYLAVETVGFGKQFYRLEGIVTIGRSTSNTIPLADPRISPTHARVVCNSGTLILEDLGSTNGTICSGKAIKRERLKPWDSFQIGMYSFQVCEADIAEEDDDTQAPNDTYLVNVLRRCFARNEAFDRQAFLKQTAVLALHHERTFFLLLQRLRLSKNKETRISLINTLPSLYDRLEGPRTAVRLLVEELCYSTEKTQHYDRNLLMLATQLLRRYRKESNIKIEATPEEVLEVEKGVHEDTVKYAQEVFATNHEAVLTKFSTIHQALVESVARSKDNARADRLPTRLLIVLLREFYIFLSLVGGSHAKAIIWQGTVSVTSPQNRLYHQPLSKGYLEGVLGLARIAIKSYVRVANKAEDAFNLRMLKERLSASVSSLEDATHQSRLRHLLRLTEERLK